MAQKQQQQQRWRLRRARIVFRSLVARKRIVFFMRARAQLERNEWTHRWTCKHTCSGPNNKLVVLRARSLSVRLHARCDAAIQLVARVRVSNRSNNSSGDGGKSGFVAATRDVDQRPEAACYESKCGSSDLHTYVQLRVRLRGEAGSLSLSPAARPLTCETCRFVCALCALRALCAAVQ